jgi:hypothetical protein
MKQRAMKHPATTPIERWSPAWLKMEVASLLDVPGYIMMHDHEKKAAGYPVTDDEMRAFIKGRREADKLLANPSLIEESIIDVPYPKTPKATPRASGATLGPFVVERHDNDDGSIAYELWTANLHHRVFRMRDDDNPNAKNDAELICKLLNNQRPD